MCRWLSYTGSPVLLDELLYKPKHSLIVQSLHATMGAETTNGDGFGVGCGVISGDLVKGESGVVARVTKQHRAQAAI